MSPFDQTREWRYLLGQMSEEETTALETEYFASGEVLEGVWEVENDLVDAFVAGQLSSEDQAAFESHYLASPVHRERVATARELQAASQGATVSSTPRRGLPAWSVWLPLAAVLVLLLASLWLQERPKPPGPVALATPAATPPSAGPSSEPVPSAAASPPRTVVAAFALSPVLLRGGQSAPTLRVPPGTDELALTLQGDLHEGIATGTRLPFGVTTVEGARVANGQLEVASDGLGVARIAAARVPPGDYILSVGAPGSPDSPLRQYFFRVVP